MTRNQGAVNAAPRKVSLHLRCRQIQVVTRYREGCLIIIHAVISFVRWFRTTVIAFVWQFLVARCTPTVAHCRGSLLHPTCPQTRFIKQIPCKYHPFRFCSLVEESCSAQVQYDEGANIWLAVRVGAPGREIDYPAELSQADFDADEAVLQLSTMRELGIHLAILTLAPSQKYAATPVSRCRAHTFT